MKPLVFFVLFLSLQSILLKGQCSSSNDPSVNNPTNYDTSLSIEENYNAARRWEEGNLSLPANCLGNMVPPSVGWGGMSEDAIALYIHNSERVAREELPLYDIEASLQNVAQAHGEWQIKNDVFSHGGDPALGNSSSFKACSSCTSTTGSSLTERINSDPDLYGEWEFIGENLAVNRTSGSSISEMVARGIYRWIYQDGSGWGHRHNVLHTYTNGWGNGNTEGFIGVGLYGEDNYTYCNNCSYPDWYGKILVVDYFDPFASSSGFTFKGLPIELLAFNAEIKGKEVFISWSTASQTNTDYFIVERSNTGFDFEELSSIDAAGFSNSKLDYSCYDDNPIVGTNYYRLKQVDFDGHFSLSDIKQVAFEKEDYVSISPNPTEGFVLVNSYFSDETNAKLINIKGDVLNSYALPKGENQTKIDLSALKSGIYFIRFSNYKYKKTIKIIKI